MGMDIYGRKPDNATGKYFRNNIWWWPDLWGYCLLVAPKIAKKVALPWTNEGSGLGKKASLDLAKTLRKELAAGRTAKHKPKTGGLFTVENVAEFAEFLEHCGGFKIW